MKMTAPPFCLVVQSTTPLDETRLAQLAAQLDAHQITRPQPELARLTLATREPGDHAIAQCAQWGWDAAVVPDAMRFADLGLLVSDMDSTLITIECIDEVADMQGLKAQVAAITERSMCGELDFAASLRERVALLAGLEASALERVYHERLQLTPGAETLVAACQAHGVKFLLISGGFTFFTERLQRRLGLHASVANQLEVQDGRLTGRLTGPVIDAEAKRSHLIAMRDQLGLRPEQVLAVGDGANDLPMLSTAGIGVAFHAKPLVRQQADVAINHCGLDGIVRLFR